MAKVKEERSAIAVKKYPDLYDKSILTFQKKTKKKMLWKR